MCRKEERDDADLARFKSSVTTPNDDGSLLGSRRGVPVLEMLAGAVGRALFGKKQPYEKPFAQRTPEDIRAWRRTAGVKTRL
jgi:hypothetical protein